MMKEKKDVKINFEVGPKIVRIADIINIPRETFDEMIKCYHEALKEVKNNG